METKEFQAEMKGTFTTNLYEVSFEDKKNPSENGLGFVTMVAAPNGEMARKFFLIAEPDCEIREVAEHEEVLCPLVSFSEGMTLTDYQEKAMTTCMDTSRNVEYMLLNLIGEVGELAEKMQPYCREFTMVKNIDMIKMIGKNCGMLAKRIRKGEQKLYAPVDVDKIGEEEKEAIMKEAGDVLWQLAGFCEVMGKGLEGVAQQNLDKLSARKQAGTIDGNGDGVSAEERKAN